MYLRVNNCHSLYNVHLAFALSCLIVRFEVFFGNILSFVSVMRVES